MRTPPDTHGSRSSWAVILLGTGRAAAVLIAAVMFVGCGDGGNERMTRHVSGDPALTDSTLIEILADLHLADARRFLAARDSLQDSTLQHSTSPDSASPDQPDLLLRLTGDAAAVDSVLDAHGVTRAGYDSALDWYVDHPDQFVNLYNRVLDRLNQVR